MKHKTTRLTKQPRAVYKVLAATMVLAWAALSFVAATPKLLRAAELPLQQGEFDALEGWKASAGMFGVVSNQASRLGHDSMATANDTAELWQHVDGARIEAGVYTLSAAFEQPRVNGDHSRTRTAYLELRAGTTAADGRLLGRTEHTFADAKQPNARVLTLRHIVKPDDPFLERGLVVVAGFSTGGTGRFGQLRFDTVRLHFDAAGDRMETAEGTLPISEPPPLSLGVNFDGHSAADDLADSDAAGFTAAAHWNCLPPKNGSVRDLRLANGKATTATLTLSGTADGNLTANFMPADSHQKLLHGRFDFSTERGEYPVIKVDRLPGELVASGYDVTLYTYRPPDSQAKFSAAYAVNGAHRIGFPAKTLPKEGAWRETPHGSTGHAIIFRGLSGDQFTLKAMDPPDYGQGSICALQIVARRPSERQPLILPLSCASDEDTGNWGHGDGTPTTTEPSWIPGGGQCVRFQGTEKTHRYSLNLAIRKGSNGLVEPIAARGFDRLAFRVRNPDTDQKSHVSLRGAFEGGGRDVQESVYLAPGESREVTADLSARGLSERSDHIVGINAMGTGTVLLEDLELIAEPVARLRPMQRETVPLGETATLWLTATVPDDAPAGLYRGTVTISAQTAGSRTLPVELEVYDFAIPPPERTSLQTLFWEREESRYLEPLLKNYRIEAGLMELEKDWSAEDMRQADHWGKQHFRIGHLQGVGGPPHLDPRLDWNLPLLGRRLARAEAAGVRERCYLYAYDEAGHPAHGASHKHEPEALFNSAKRVHESYPDLQTMSTPLIFDASGPESDMRDGVRDLDILVAWIKNYSSQADKMEQARRWGYEMWCYTCLGVPPRMGNIYIDSNTPADLRSLLGSQAFREGWRGFLYWDMRFAWTRFQPLTPLQPGQVKTAFRPVTICLRTRISMKSWSTTAC